MWDPLGAHGTARRLSQVKKEYGVKFRFFFRSINGTGARGGVSLHHLRVHTIASLATLCVGSHDSQARSSAYCIQHAHIMLHSQREKSRRWAGCCCCCCLPHSRNQVCEFLGCHRHLCFKEAAGIYSNVAEVGGMVWHGSLSERALPLP